MKPKQTEQKQLGRYLLFRPLFGRSKGTQTYLAREMNVDRVVEFHMIDKTLSANPEIRQRFLHECKIISGLDHPNVIKIMDFGLIDGHLYYTVPSRNSMRLRKLRENLGGRMDEETTLGIATTLASAVAHLHEHDILHRDIDLDTVFMDLDADNPYLADFSLAKQAGKGGLTAVGIKRTRKVQIVPEIVFRLPIDKRTDIYLLGLVFYSLLTGDDPSILELAQKDSSGGQPDLELKHLDAHGLGMDPAFSQVVMRMVSPKPDDRFQTTHEMDKAFKKLFDKAKVHNMIEQMKSDAMSSQTELITKALVEKAEHAKEHRQRQKEERKKNKKSLWGSNSKALKAPVLPGWGLWPIAGLLGMIILCLVASFVWDDTISRTAKPTPKPTKTNSIVRVSEAEFKKVRDEVIKCAIEVQSKTTASENYEDRRNLLYLLVTFGKSRNRKVPFTSKEIEDLDSLFKKDPIEAYNRVNKLFTRLYKSLPPKLVQKYRNKI